MKIAFYAPLKSPDHPVASGDRTVARALLAALRLAGHEAKTVCRFRSFDAGDPARQARLERLGGRLADRLERRLGAGFRPDLWFTYHLYHKAPDWLGPRIAGRLGVPYVIAEASHAPKQAGGRWAPGHRAVARAVGAADLVLQLNPNDADCIRPLVAAPDRLMAMRPFLDTRPFREARADREAVAARYGLDPSVPWLFTVAMMRADQKLLSYRCLGEALVPVRDLPWRLLVAGGGPAEAEVRKTFAPVADRVDFLGTLDGDALPALYAAADLYVWPAVKEAWSMAFLESQAAGLPAVAGRSGGVPEVIADGETGLLVPEGDAAAFGSAVRHMLEHPEQRRAMGRAAAARSLREHDLSAAARILDTRLRALVPATGGPAS